MLKVDLPQSKDIHTHTLPYEWYIYLTALLCLSNSVISVAKKGWKNEYCINGTKKSIKMYKQAPVEQLGKLTSEPLSLVEFVVLGESSMLMNMEFRLLKHIR